MLHTSNDWKQKQIVVNEVIDNVILSTESSISKVIWLEILRGV